MVDSPYVYRDAQARYLHDAHYHAVVDVLVNAMRAMRMTPGEVRDAAMLAAVKFEAERASPLFPSALKNRGHAEACPCDACRYDRGQPL